MDNAARKPGLFTASSEDRDQIEADRIGLFVVAASGYDPKAAVTMFDRLLGTEGKTGSVLSRMFGTQSPDAKRLGELIKNSATLPAGCAETPPPGRAESYRQWQIQVASFIGTGRQEALHDVIGQKQLAPFRGEITHLRFSPDGQYVLAQDSSGISVLARDPLAMLFRIDSSDAEPAAFTPDSKDVVFHTSDLRVIHWSVAAKRLTEMHDLYFRKTCLATTLSPDANTLACLAEDFELSLIDVASEKPVFQKKDFRAVSPALLMALLRGASLNGPAEVPVTMVFSPDSRYFVAGAYNYPEPSTLVYDVTSKAVVPLKGVAKKLTSLSFAFIGPTRLVGLNPDDPSKSGVVQLPGGEVVEQFAVPTGKLASASKGNFVFVRPFQKYGVGVFDLATKTVTKGNATPAIDVFESVFLAERGTGDLGLYAMEGNQVRSTAALPASRLGRIRAASVSPDLRWLALSERTRGVLWDADAGERITQTRRLDGAYVDNAGTLYSDMPRSGVEPRAITEVDGRARTSSSGPEIKERYAVQYGRWMLVTRPLPLEGNSVPTGLQVEWRDVSRQNASWKKDYPKFPPDDAWASGNSDALVLSWKAESPAGRERIRVDENLRKTVQLGDVQGDYVLEVLDAQSGNTRAVMLLETGKGSFHIHDILVKGDWLVVSDSIGRVLVYSVATRELQGYAVGTEPIVNTTAGLMAVSTGGGRIVLYDLKTLRRRDQLTFTREIPLKAFNADGTRLFVLTDDQRAHVLAIK
jgi:WD40 repeat protein